MESDIGHPTLKLKLGEWKWCVFYYSYIFVRIGRGAEEEE
jgi:hypothetical protein